MIRSRRVVGTALVAAAVALAGSAIFVNSREMVPVATSRNEMLSAVWQKYVRTYVDKDGRVLDKQQNDVSTSEGQSYAMLRAVWQDDRSTFDRVWKFTKTALARPDDHLFAWKFGKRADGSYGVLADEGGRNTASDADSDIALALTMAYGRWQQSSYLQDAQPIMADIWSKEVVQVGGRPILAGNDLEKASTADVLVNPSYLSPYAYRIFANVDKAHDWKSLISSSYDVIDKAIASPLDKSSSAGLAPNWVRINRGSGAVSATGSGDLTTEFGYDALRLPWRMALDYRWNAEQRAKDVLVSLHFLGERYAADGRLAATYSHDGKDSASYESPAMYGGSMGFFAVTEPGAASDVYTTKLASLYDTDTQGWRTPLSYYDDNWAWFGMALQLGALPNLAEGVK